jgi:hypothetical protein
MCAQKASGKISSRLSAFRRLEDAAFRARLPDEFLAASPSFYQRSRHLYGLKVRKYHLPVFGKPFCGAFLRRLGQ